MSIRFDLLAIALGLGLLFAVVDTSPNWNETGVMAVAVAASCLVLGATVPRQPWLWALALGMWIPIFNITKTVTTPLRCAGFCFSGGLRQCNAAVVPGRLLKHTQSLAGRLRAKDSVNCGSRA